MKLLFIHAHCDDYEFTAAGLFEMWRRKSGSSVQRRVIICTDGKAGHQFRTREETGEMRLREQQASAEIGGYEFRMLRLPNGQIPREACLLPSTELMAALWHAIREFEPDYLFCPPVPSDPLAGIHVDHAAVAEAVRRVAYMVNVPHAFTPEYPADERHSTPCKVPVIVNVYDSYTVGANTHDLAVDVSDAFELIAQMSWQHQSQIKEWLPWVGRHAIQQPASYEQWKQILAKRFSRKNEDLGVKSDCPLEVFTVTGWGAVPSYEQLTQEWPRILSEGSRLDNLRLKLDRLGTI